MRQMIGINPEIALDRRRPCTGGNLREPMRPHSNPIRHSPTLTQNPPVRERKPLRAFFGGNSAIKPEGQGGRPSPMRRIRFPFPRNALCRPGKSLRHCLPRKSNPPTRTTARQMVASIPPKRQARPPRSKSRRDAASASDTTNWPQGMQNRERGKGRKATRAIATKRKDSGWE